MKVPFKRSSLVGVFLLVVLLTATIVNSGVASASAKSASCTVGTKTVKFYVAYTYYTGSYRTLNQVSITTYNYDGSIWYGDANGDAYLKAYGGSSVLWSGVKSTINPATYRNINIIYSVDGAPYIEARGGYYSGSWKRCTVIIPNVI